MRTGLLRRQDGVYLRVMGDATEGEVSELLEHHQADRDYGRQAECVYNNFGEPRYILVPVRSDS